MPQYIFFAQYQNEYMRVSPWIRLLLSSDIRLNNGEILSWKCFTAFYPFRDFITFECIISRTSYGSWKIKWPLLACRWPISSGSLSDLVRTANETKGLIAPMCCSRLRVPKTWSIDRQTSVLENRRQWWRDLNILKVIRGELKALRCRRQKISFYDNGNIWGT